MDDRGPGEWRGPDRKDAVASGCKVILSHRAIGHRPGVVEGVGAHRAAGGQEAHSHHREPRSSPATAGGGVSRIHAFPLFGPVAFDPTGWQRRPAAEDRRDVASPGDIATDGRCPRAGTNPVDDSQQRLFPPQDPPNQSDRHDRHLEPIRHLHDINTENREKDRNQPPGPFWGISIPIRAMRCCMSSQTSRFAAGFRNR